MPLGYFVQAHGRSGAELRVARGTHELVALGPSARIGTLLPHHTTTTTASPDGRPLEVRLPFVLALWLVLGCLLPAEDMLDLFVYEYIVGAERLGAALDLLLKSFESDIDTVCTPSVLRRKFLELGIKLREADPVPFTVTLACLLVVGGNADNLECSNLATPMIVPPLVPVWILLVTFAMLLSPDGTLVLLSELECVWMPRFFATQRAAAGSFAAFDALLSRALSIEEAAIINALAAAGKADQFSRLAVTLLPTAPEMVSFPRNGASAALALSRAFSRAVAAGGALTITVHDVLTVIPHYAAFYHAIGTELGAPAALGLLLEAVRAALNSPTATLSLGNVAVLRLSCTSIC